MKAFQSLASVLHLMVLFIFFGVSLFLISLYWAEQCREIIAFILIEAPFFSLVFGIFLFVVTLLLTISFATVYKPHYLSLKAAPFTVDVDTSIIAKYVEKHLEETFADIEAYVQVFFHKQKELEIAISTDKVLEITKKASLKQIESQVGIILHDLFDYTQPFILTFSTMK